MTQSPYDASRPRPLSVKATLSRLIEENAALRTEVERLTEQTRLAQMQADQSNSAVGELTREVERLRAELDAARATLAAVHLCDCNPAARTALPKEGGQ
jgi:regulator of replication initiation timing